MMNTTTPGPDYQLKFACPKCGAIARMTRLGTLLSRGIICAEDGVKFAPATRRKYTRRTAVES